MILSTRNKLPDSLIFSTPAFLLSPQLRWRRSELMAAALNWISAHRRPIASLLSKTICCGFSSRRRCCLSRRDSDRVFNSSRSAHFTALNQQQQQLQYDPPLPEQYDTNHNQEELDFPGGKVRFTSQMQFLSELPEQRIPCFRVLDGVGQLLYGKSFPQLSREVAVKMYKDMVTIQIMDAIFFTAQRQGRISFYLTSDGEEAISVATAAALKPDDCILPQYREPGILLWRGFTLQEFANQCFGNKADYGKGRQMAIHYGSMKHNYLTISSPLGTQLPQAVGVAYSLKMDKKDACAVTFFGDGCSSEGDFHAALNFAAVTESPVIFICRNNGWAISTPSHEQFRSDGIVVKGQGYGIRSIRIDGNDALAVYEAVHKARTIAIKEQRPILIEALTYRVGHHSTSDDSTKYRPIDEIECWKMTRNPVNRFRNWIAGNGWWSDDLDAELQKKVKTEIMEAIQVAEKMQKPPVAEMFADVYDTVPTSLLAQERSLRETIGKHSQDYPIAEVPLS